MGKASKRAKECSSARWCFMFCVLCLVFGVWCLERCRLLLRFQEEAEADCGNDVFLSTIKNDEWIKRSKIYDVLDIIDVLRRFRWGKSLIFV